MKKRIRGFTLIELMMVVSIIAILASIAMPKFADMLIKAQEGSLKGNIGSMRSALSIYYSDNQGLYPACSDPFPVTASVVFTGTLAPSYIPAIPQVNNTLHNPTNNVVCDGAANILGGAPHDGDGWYYDGTSPTDQLNGSIWVACDHADTAHTTWTTY